MKKNAYERCVELVQNWAQDSVVTEKDLRSLKKQFSYGATCTTNEQGSLHELIEHQCAQYRIKITLEHERKGLAWCQKVAKQGEKNKFWEGNTEPEIEAFKEAVAEFREFQFRGMDTRWDGYWNRHMFMAFWWGLGDVDYAYGSWQNGSKIQIRGVLKMAKHWWTCGSGRIELQIKLEDAESCAHQGRYDDDVESLLKVPYIAKQLAKLDSELVRLELREYGAWDGEELADHEMNLTRLLWIACNDVSEENSL